MDCLLPVQSAALFRGPVFSQRLEKILYKSAGTVYYMFVKL